MKHGVILMGRGQPSLRTAGSPRRIAPPTGLAVGVGEDVSAGSLLQHESVVEKGGMDYSSLAGKYTNARYKPISRVRVRGVGFEWE